METRVHARQDKTLDELLYTHIVATLYFFYVNTMYIPRIPRHRAIRDHKYSSSALKTNNLIKAECVNYSGRRVGGLQNSRWPTTDASDKHNMCDADETENLYLTMYMRPGIISIFNEWPIQRLAPHKAHGRSCICAAARTERDGWIDVGWLHYTHAGPNLCICMRTASPNTHTCPYTAITLSVYILIEPAPRKLTVKTCNRFQKLWWWMPTVSGQSGLRMRAILIKSMCCKTSILQTQAS